MPVLIPRLSSLAVLSIVEAGFEEGNRFLRKALFNAAKAGLRTNPVA